MALQQQPSQQDMALQETMCSPAVYESLVALLDSSISNVQEPFDEPNFALSLEPWRDTPGAESAILDILWLYDCDVYPESEANKVFRERLVAVARSFKSQGWFQSATAVKVLEPGLLQALGLISNAQSFTKKQVRINTAALYKQQRFNLFREESEGYSKLIVLVASALSHYTPTTRQSVVSGLVKDVQETIGYFDLDPNRAFDVILDAATYNVVYHWEFFVTFFTESPWFELNSPPDTPYGYQWSFKRLTTDTYRAQLNALVDCENGPLDYLASLVRTFTPGNEAASQLIGAKLHAPQSSPEFVEKLVYLTAILLKLRLIDIRDVLPHLRPNKEGLKAKISAYKKSLDDEAFAARGSALSMAAPLADDSDTAANTTDKDVSKAETEAAEPEISLEAPEEELADTLAPLIKALLAIGETCVSSWLLLEFPGVTGPYPEIQDHICLACHVMMSSIYEQVSPFASLHLSDAILTQKRRRFIDSTSGSSIVSPDNEDEPELSLDSSAKNQSHRSSKRKEFFFANGFADHLPVCQNLEDFKKIVVPWLLVVSIRLYRDVSLIFKICRIGRADLKSISYLGHDFWLSVCRSLLLPCIPMVGPNPGLVNEIYSLIKQYSYPVRYGLYGDWSNTIYKEFPELKVKRAFAEKEAKSALRRLTKENVKSIGKLLSKTSHANPCVVFQIMLNQIESYDNMVEVVVDAAKSITICAYDVLSFSLLTALSNDVKKRLKDDGTSIAQWLQGLAQFTGRLFRRYSTLDPLPVITYVIYQIKANNPYDLIILKELVGQMAGLQPLVNLSENQMQSLAGGELLASRALSLINESKATVKKSCTRLMDCLQREKLSGPVLVMLCQLSKTCAYRVPDFGSQLKLLGNLQDECNDVLHLFSTLLTANLSKEDYAKLVPSLDSLLSQYGLDVVVAFHVVRQILKEEIAHSRLEIKNAAKSSAGSDVMMEVEPENEEEDGALPDDNETVAKMKELETAVNEDSILPENLEKSTKKVLQESTKEAPENLTNSASQKPTDKSSQETANKGLQEPIKEASQDPKESFEEPSKEEAGTGADLTESNADENKYASNLQGIGNGVQCKTAFGALSKRLFEHCEAFIPETSLSSFSWEFYVIFWQMSLYDISVPISQYDNEQKSIQASIQKLELERTDVTTMTKNRKEVSQLREASASLRAELKEQMIWFEATRKELMLLKSEFFPSIQPGAAAREKRAYDLLQYCLYPRYLFSPNDAAYCARLLRMLHVMGTPGFSTLTIVDKILDDSIAAITFSCTEREAQNYGRFLSTLLGDLTSWYRKENLFNTEGRGSPNLLPGLQKRWPSNENELTSENVLTYDEYRRLLLRWHRKMTNAFKICLQSKEYMHIRNAVIVLGKIIDWFPIIDWSGKTLLGLCTEIKDKDPREDLKVFVLGYHAILAKKQASWVSQPVFMGVQPEQPTGAKKLAPTAEPFIPDPKKSAEPRSSKAQNDAPLGPKSTTMPDRSSIPAKKSSKAKEPQKGASDRPAPNNARDSSQRPATSSSSALPPQAIRDGPRSRSRNDAAYPEYGHSSTRYGERAGSYGAGDSRYYDQDYDTRPRGMSGYPVDRPHPAELERADDRLRGERRGRLVRNAPPTRPSQTQEIPMRQSGSDSRGAASPAASRDEVRGRRDTVDMRSDQRSRSHTPKATSTAGDTDTTAARYQEPISGDASGANSVKLDNRRGFAKAQQPPERPPERNQRGMRLDSKEARATSAESFRGRGAVYQPEHQDSPRRHSPTPSRNDRIIRERQAEQNDRWDKGQERMNRAEYGERSAPRTSDRAEWEQQQQLRERNGRVGVGSRGYGQERPPESFGRRRLVDERPMPRGPRDIGYEGVRMRENDDSREHMSKRRRTAR